jgi:hypothetical protein
LVSIDRLGKDQLHSDSFQDDRPFVALLNWALLHRRGISLDTRFRSENGLDAALS